MFDKYPYTNYHELNLEYFIKHFQEIFDQWNTLYNQLLSWKDSTTEELEAWKTEVENGIADEQARVLAELEAWKTETGEDIDDWEASVLTALNSWKSDFETLFATTFANLTQIKTDAETARDAAQVAQAAAEDAADSVSASAAQITTNQNNIANIVNNTVKKASIISHYSVPVVIDTTNRTITFADRTYAVYGNNRYDLSNISCQYSEAGTADAVCFYDVTQNTARCLVYTSYMNVSDKILLFVFHKTELNVINQIDINVSYSIDGTVYDIKNKPFVQTTGQNTDVAMSQKATTDAIENAKPILQNFGRITWNGANGANVITFDTANRTITFGSAAFLMFNDVRYELRNKSCTYPNSGSTLVCYYNIASGEIAAVAHSSFNPNGNIILFDFLRANWGVDANTLSCNYSVDGTNYVCKEKKRSPEVPEIVYVSSAGSDSGAGTRSDPVLTIGEAIARGTKNVCVMAGLYRVSAPIEFTSLIDVNIFADNYDSYPSPSVPRSRPMFVGGDDYNTFTIEQGGILSFIPTSVPNRYTQVFIDHTLDPVSSGTRPSPNACLWAHYDDVTGDKMLTPVVSRSDLNNTTDSFYYDGTNIYFNAQNVLSVTVGFDYNSIFKLTSCRNITITGIIFMYGGQSNAILHYCQNLKVQNCKFAYTSFSDGVTTNYSESTFINCESFKARNDGFNCHFYGITHYIDCHSHYNGDDGESSHEYCVVEVNGGEYDHNGKGGHSPVNGCKFYDNGSYSHHNAYGFYCVAQGSETVTYIIEPMLIMNAISVNNTTDILANRAELIVGNTKYVTHSEVNNGTLTNLNDLS